MNTEKFKGKGGVYSFARPSYPAALFERLTNEKIISKDTVAADVGAGTGIFSAALCPYVKRVYAVEPNADMRNAGAEGAERTKSAVSKAVGGIGTDNSLFKEKILWKEGTAENTLLSDKSVDLVTAAQAFHWFDRAAFKTECRRILKNDGFAVLVWNNKDQGSPIIKDCSALFKELCPDFKGASNGFDFEGDAFDDFFESSPKMASFENHTLLDREHFIKRQLSSSFAPKSGDGTYERFVEGCEKIFEKYQKNGRVIFPYTTVCYYGKI